MIYLELFLGFLKVGCFAFGGAYGAIPLIRDVVSFAGWLDDESLAYMIGVSESTPGPIMVNLATYVGNSQAKLLGAIVSTLAVVLPSFIIIQLVMKVWGTVFSNKYIQAMLKGVKPCVTGIILATGISMAARNLSLLGKNGPDDIWAVVITIVLAGLMLGVGPVLKKKISPILLIAVSAVLGMVIYGG